MQQSCVIKKLSSASGENEGENVSENEYKIYMYIQILLCLIIYGAL